LKGETISQTTNLNVASLTTATQIATPTIKTTNIEFFDVAESGATDLTITSNSIDLLRFSPSICIKFFRYANFNNNDIYNLRDITSVRNILGEGDCLFSAARGSYNYLQVSGGTSLRPTIPGVQGIFIGNSSSTSSGIEIAASGDTHIDFTSPMSDYKGRIKYDNANGKLDFYTNSSATAVLSLSAGLVSSAGIISSSGNITTSTGNITTTTGNVTTTTGNIQSIQGSVGGVLWII